MYKIETKKSGRLHAKVEKKRVMSILRHKITITKVQRCGPSWLVPTFLHAFRRQLM